MMVIFVIIIIMIIIMIIIIVQIPNVSLRPELPKFKRTDIAQSRCTKQTGEKRGVVAKYARVLVVNVSCARSGPSTARTA